MKKVLILFATLAFCGASCFADRIAEMSGTVFMSHPQTVTAAGLSEPVLFSIAGGVLLLLGLLRSKQSA
jgi:hypothetical protein